MPTLPTRAGWGLLLALCSACPDKPVEPLRALTPPPLPTLEDPPRAAVVDGGPDDAREALHHVLPAEVFGEPRPADAARFAFEGPQPVPAELLAAARAQRPVSLRFGEEAYLAQATEWLAALDDADAELYFEHPSADVAYRVVLRDEAAFREWLDEARPGKVRVIQRADGFELQTNVGKLRGGDPNGPSVPTRGGQFDLGRLRYGLAQLQGRFHDAPDLCFVPSFGLELRRVVEAMSSDFTAPGEPTFKELCLVYPRPKK